MNDRTRRQGTRLVLLITIGATLISLASLFAYHILQRRLSGPLLAAIRDDNRTAVQNLLGRGASANSVESSGENTNLWGFWSRPDPQQSESTALMQAAQNGDSTILRLLLDRGADVNARNRSGETALMWAAKSGDLETVRMLLDRGADVHASSREGDTALGNAAASGSTQLTQLLLDRGAEDKPAGKTGKTALIWMVQRDDLPLVQQLLDTRPEYVNLRDKRGKTALMYAVAYDPNPGTGGHSSPVSGDGKIHLKESAAARKHREIVKLLLSKGADVNSADNDGRTALMVAASVLWPEGVQLLLENGADVQVRDKSGQTALLHALDKRGVEYSWALPNITINPTYVVIQQLLDKGADIHARDKSGQDVLSLAIQRRKEYLISDLLDRGADASGEGGLEALMEAASGGEKDLVRRLLDRGADVNGRGGNGKTPLLAAVCFGGQEIVPLLLARGANVNAKDSSGKTALAYALAPGGEGRPSIVPLLQKAGAKQ